MHSLTLVRTLALMVAAAATGLTHGAAPDRATLDKIAALSVPFVPNAGQWDARAAFAAKTFAGTLFVTRSGELVYSLPGKLVDPAHATDAADGIGCALRTKPTPGAPSAPYAASCRAPTERTPGWVLSETLIDASGKPRSMSQSTVKAPAGFLPMEGKVSYGIGNDPSKHADNLNSYERVNLGDMYPGVNVQLRATGNNVEKIFTVAANRDPKQIHIRIKGAERLEIGDHGELIAHTGRGPVAFTAPIAFQLAANGERSAVAVAYRLDATEQRYGFNLGAYDASLPLTIDPLLQSSYLGGTGGSDVALALAIHPASGEVYVAGYTDSSDLPGVVGGAQAVKSTGRDAFVSRFNAALTTRLQSSYLGGDGTDFALALAIHPASGEVYVAGYTESTDLPGVTGGAQAVKPTGPTDAFVSRFNAALTTRLQSSYLGGTGTDFATALAIHPASGEVYVAGVTNSTDLPGVAGGAQAVKSTGFSLDAFVSRFNALLTTRLQSSYLGGTGTDEARALAIHPASGEVYVAGVTVSTDLPGVAGGAQAVKSSSGDAFVSRFNALLTTRLQSSYLGGTGTDQAQALAIHPASGEVYVAGQTDSTDLPGVAGGAQAAKSTGTDAFVSRLSAPLDALQRRPVFLLPGIAATYALDVANDLSWLLERGIAPSALQIDPLGRTYADLIQTLINAGYVLDKDLFVVNYDWRLTPGPDDEAIDGRVSGLTAASISASGFRYGVDYFGLALRRVSERWTLDHPTLPPLDAVDVIAHSTGGLVARTYIQSDAYGGVYAGIKTLPKVNNLLMIGVPNRGASKAWNPLHDNWVVDPVFELVLSKIINRAYQKVLSGRLITGPDRTISLASLAAPNCVGPREVCFINQYVPTIRSLLATYDFLDAGSGFTHVNANPLVRNSLVLDLNAGLDLSLVGDPNAFASATLVKPTVIYGTNGGDPILPVLGLRPGTPTAAVQRQGPSTDPFPFASLSIARFADAGPHNAATGETWYRDIMPNVSGDGTVPLDSSRDQFVGDGRFVLMPFTKGGNTTGDVGHTELPSNVDVQQAVLTVLGASCVSPCVISTGAAGASLGAAACAVTGCLNFILDPVEGFVVDRLGRRLGYSAATGPLKEIPNSVWYGKTDGMGWVFGPVEEPLTLELTGLGGDYYTAVSLIGLNGRSGVVDQGTLASGTHRSVPVPLLSGSPKLTVVKAGSGTGTVSASAGAINCGATCSDIYPLGTATTLTATATGGSAFTGWLGSCNGEANCALPMTDNVAATATFAAAPIPAPKLDVDGTAGCGALTDGMLIMRHLLGLSGSSLTAGAVGTGATRNEAAIGIHLTDVKPYLDVDGNGRADPLTDGVLTLRYLFGLRGSALIAGAVGSGAARVSAADIEGRLLGLCAN